MIKKGNRDKENILMSIIASIQYLPFLIIKMISKYYDRKVSLIFEKKISEGGKGVSIVMDLNTTQYQI